MASTQSPTDSALDNLAEETAKEVAVESGELSDELHGTLTNADGDPCNSYEWSVIFILVFCVSYVLLGIHSWTMFKRRASLTAIDVLSVALFVSTIIQFGPMMSQVLHSGHSVYHFTQTGCKVLFFTDYGMRHVITFLVVSLFIYSYLVLFQHFNAESLDAKFRNNVAWLIITLFGIEGLFGMPAAIYVDVGPKQLQSCVWTQSMDLTLGHIVSLEMVLRPITPYLLPMLVVAFPLIRMTQLVRTMEESKSKSTVFTCIVLVWAYFLMNLPYALLLIIESASQLTEASLSISWVTVCNFKWAFFLVHQGWFLFLPCCLIAHEVEVGNRPPGSDAVVHIWRKAKNQLGDRMRMP